MIVDAEKIYINGTPYPVYAADFSNGGSQSPSTLEIKIVNESGQYKHPTKTTASPTVIRIGNFFEFRGYPVSSTVSEGPGGNVLSIKYVDTSITLDKIFVGLRGVHGAGFTTVSEGAASSNIILIGEQVDPCKGLASNYEDPCDPCLQSAGITQVSGDVYSEEASKKIIDCETQKKLQILDIVYKFRDLLNAVQGRPLLGIRFFNIPRLLGTDEYFSRHTGSLREVLNKWCQEYNITYIWQNGDIVFIDLKNGIEINDSNIATQCQIVDKSETQTIEDNSSYGTISYFGMNGEVREGNCGESPVGFSQLSLVPLTLRDILGTATGEGTQIAINWKDLGYKSLDESPIFKNEEEKIEGLLAILAMGKVLEQARDLFILRYGYNFFTNLNDKPEDNAGKTYPELGIHLTKMVPKDDTDLGTIIENSVELNAATLKKKKLTRDNFVFYKGYRKVGLKERYIKFENKLTDDFVGKYWIRLINSGSSNYSGPDGSINVYRSSAQADNPGFLLDIANFLPNTWSTITNNFVKTSLSEDGKQLENVRQEKSAIVLERPGAWSTSPVGNVMDTFQDVVNKIRAPFLEFDSNKEAEETEEDKTEEEENRVKIVYFAFYKPSANELRAVELDSNMTVVDHPFEVKNVQTEQNNATYSYGLRSTKCKSFTVAKGQIRFYTPVQCWDYGKVFGGYVVNRSGSSFSGTKTLVGIDKIEYVLTKVPPLDDLSVSLNINYRDLTQPFVQLLEKGATRQCGYSISAVRQLVGDFSRSMFDPPVNPKNKVLIRRDYSIAGLPATMFTLKDGLDNLSIRYSSSDGWNCQLSFSSRPRANKSEVALTRDFERTWMQNYGAKVFKSEIKNVI
jgi:hypothetical protein